ncbi:hypothetical protein TWF594_011891 [Orbilia oligospora]|nr:hypothetical protein TWF706_012022 [Orbilia oligospora]KAF3130484.1 hypothetical protein TWF594_011891 [Orbilia oligospora]
MQCSGNIDTLARPPISYNVITIDPSPSALSFKEKTHCIPLTLKLARRIHTSSLFFFALSEQQNPTRNIQQKTRKQLPSQQCPQRPPFSRAEMCRRFVETGRGFIGYMLLGIAVNIIHSLPPCPSNC